MTYPEAVAYLESFVDYERLTNYPYQSSMKLDRMRCFLAEIGNPHERVPSLHVAGSKGKGSVCAFLYGILQAAGYRVGLYTSPHLVDVRERVRVTPGQGTRDKGQGQAEVLPQTGLTPQGSDPIGKTGLERVPGEWSIDWIGEEEFAELVMWLRPRAEAFAQRSTWGALTYFEILTVIAFEYFTRRRAEIAVLEVGLGGRLDSTNVVTPLVCGITSLSLDHTAILGGTLEAIAAEKAGILKPGVPAVVASQALEAAAVIEETAGRIGAPLWRVGAEVRWRDDGCDHQAQRFSVSVGDQTYERLTTTLLGAHQLENAAVAVGMIEALHQRGWLPRIDEEVIRRGIAEACWPGRMEMVRRHPTVLLDGAHNPASARALADGLRRHDMAKEVVLMLGTASDKEIAGIVLPLVPLCRFVIATQVENPRASPAEWIAEAVRALGVPCRQVSNVREAVAVALEAAGDDGTVVVTGSLYLVGAVRRLLADDAGMNAVYHRDIPTQSR